MPGTVGFIGIGKMGTPMSRNLCRAGVRVLAYDVLPEAAARAREAGAAVAGSLREIGEGCDEVITILPNSRVVEAVVLEAGGLLECMRPGSLVIEMTSAEPSSTRRLHATLAARGVGMIDAPVSGGVAGAEAATLAIMAGGDPAMSERARPLLEKMGKHLFHMGDIGAGHAMKAVNNFVAACALLATSEAMVTAVKFGLDSKKVCDVLNASSGRSQATEFKVPRAILSRTFNLGFALQLYVKDLRIFTNLARELGVPVPVATTVENVYDMVDKVGGPGLDGTEVYRFIERWAGLEEGK